MARNTHARIIEGARSLFFTAGYDGTRLEHLAAILGIAKKTIYNHFNSKEDLLVAVLDRDLQAWIAETREIVRQPGLEMGERFLQLQRRAIAALERRAAIFPRASGGPRQRMRTEMEARFVRELADLFAEMIALAKHSGHLLPEVDARAMAHVLINMGAGIAAYCGSPAVPYDVPTLLNESIRMVFTGVLTELGRRRLEEIGFTGELRHE